MFIWVLAFIDFVGAVFLFIISIGCDSCLIQISRNATQNNFCYCHVYGLLQYTLTKIFRKKYLEVNCRRICLPKSVKFFYFYFYGIIYAEKTQIFLVDTME